MTQPYTATTLPKSAARIGEPASPEWNLNLGDNGAQRYVLYDSMGNAIPDQQVDTNTLLMQVLIELRTIRLGVEMLASANLSDPGPQA